MAVKRNLLLNTLPENAVRVVYSLVHQDPVTSGNLETSALVLFNVYNYSRSKEFSELRTVLKRDARKQNCTVKVGQFLLCAQGEEWYRAYVIHVQSHTFTVFFIDYGFCADLRNMYDKYEPLPAEFGPDVFESQSYKISLYGLMPVHEIIPLYEGAPEPRAQLCDYWLPSHALFIREQLKQADKIYFHSVFREGEIEFGRIYVEQHEKTSSLGDLLIEKRLAVQCNNEAGEMNRIALQVKEFRGERTFDRKPSVRKLLWPTAVCELEKEEWFETIEPKAKKGDEVRTRRSSTSNYSSYDDDTRPHSVSSVRSQESSVIGDSSENIAAAAGNVDDASMEDGDLDDTSEYGSEDCAWKYSSYGKYQNEITLTAMSKTPEEILMVGMENFQPARTFNSLLDPMMLMALKKAGARGMNRSQGYIIPAMLSRAPKDILFVDAPRSGKTVGCLIALLSLLRENQATSRYSISPRAIFVVPYVDRCEFVKLRCNELLSSGRNASETDLRVIVAYGRGKDLETKNMHQITRGCDLLICTPRCLARLLLNTVGFALNRVEYAVFDEFHVLIQFYLEEVTEIFRVIHEAKRQSTRRVYISNTSAAVKPFVKDTDKQMLLTPCYMEAVIYANFAFEILYKSEERKLEDIKERLSEQWRTKIVFIVLNDEEESLESMYKIEAAISQCGKSIHMLKPAMLLELNEAFEKLQGDIVRGQKPMILCTDYVQGILPERVYNADHLIHYSLPADVNMFRRRHAVLLRRARDVAETAPGMELLQTPSQEPRVTVYIQSIDQVQFPRLLNIMSHLTTNPFSRRKANLPEHVENALTEMKRQRELSRSQICIKMKLFGRCDNRELCPQRHILSVEKDQPDPRLPRSGRVKIEIAQVYGPTHFRVRLLQHAPVGNAKWEFLPLFNSVTMALRMGRHYGQNTPISLANVQEGDLVATADWESTEPLYRRVRVLKLIEGKPQKAVLKFVDVGKEAIKSVSNLCELPPDLAALPETMVDVFLCDLLPIDADIAWGGVFTEIIQKRIDEQKEKQHPFIGTIKLVVGHCMWLDPLQTEEFDKVIRANRVHFSFKSYLLHEKLALKNPEHLTELRKMSDEAGLTGKADTKDVGENPPAAGSGDGNAGPSDRPSSSGNDAGKSKDTKPVEEPTGMTPTELTDGSSRPLIIWKQDRNSLHVTIKKNIEPPYTLKHDSRRLYFKGNEGAVTYEFDEVLSHCFDSASLKHYKSGTDLVIKMDKLVKDYQKWTRLLKRRDTVKWVREAIELMSEEESDPGPSPQIDWSRFAAEEVSGAEKPGAEESVAEKSDAKKSGAKKSKPSRLEEKLGYRPKPLSDSEDSDSVSECDSDGDQTKLKDDV